MAYERHEVLHSLGSRFRYGIFESMVRFHLLPLARSILAIVVLYYTLLPSVRQRCAAYLAHRFPDVSSWRRFFYAYRLYLTFGKVLLDRIVAGTTGTFPLLATAPEVHRCLSEAMQNSCGCLILSAHIGAWQVGLAGLEHYNTPVHILQRKFPGDPEKHYFELGKGKPFHIIDATDPVGSLVEAAATLKRGEIVCLMGDRLPVGMPANHGVMTSFLGGRICLPVTAYALASMTGASLIVLFTIRDEGITRVWRAERFPIPPGLQYRNPSVFLPYAQRFALSMEEAVAHYPYQFFNFYDMWL